MWNLILLILKSIWRFLSLQTILLLIFFLLFGCNRTPSNHLYENPDFGISFEKPDNWNVEYYKRSGLILLEAKSGFWHRSSSRLEISENACYPGSWFNRPKEELNANIDRIRNSYNLESIEIIQEPIPVINEDYEITRVIIAVPTTAMFKDTSRIKVKVREPEALQTIDLYAITNEGITFFAHIYEGDDHGLNEQARNIVNSIQVICTTEP